MLYVKKIKAVNKNTLIIFSQRIWQATAGLVTILLITYYLSPTEQGYYYTLLNLSALYMLFDLGLSTIIVQISAALSSEKDKPLHITQKINSLTKLSLKWYGLSSILFILLSPLALFIIGNQEKYVFIWTVLAIASSISLLTLPLLSICEGGGYIFEVYFSRLIASVIGAITAWVILITNGGLYSVLALPVSTALVSLTWLLTRQRVLLKPILEKDVHSLNWKTDIWSLQWKVAISWIVGYITISMHVPLLFHTQGAVIAGQMGLTITIANLTSLIAMSWLTAQIPKMAQAAHKKNWRILDILFIQAASFSLFTFFLGSSLFIFSSLTISYLTSFNERLLPQDETILLFISVSLYHLILIFSAYFRVYMKEPLLPYLMISIALILLGSFLVAPTLGVKGILYTLITVNTTVVLPAIILTWFKIRKNRYA